MAVEYAKSSTLQNALRTAPVAVQNENDYTAKISLANLEPASNYFYRAVVAKQKPGPVARLVTAPRADAPRLFAETSLMVVWDDHEVADNYRAAHPLASIGRRAFMDYWPVRQDAADPDRIYRSLRWGKTAECFILDTRQYRDETAGTMLGVAQKRWFFAALSKSEARFKFTCTPVPFSSQAADKWGGYPADSDEVLKTIREKQISGIIFLAADVHYAAVVRVPGAPALREVTTGPLATPMGKGTGRAKRFEYFNNQHLNSALSTFMKPTTIPKSISRSSPIGMSRCTR